MAQHKSNNLDMECIKFFFDSLNMKGMLGSPFFMAWHKSNDLDMECINLFFDSLNMKRPLSNPLSWLDINPVTRTPSILLSFFVLVKTIQKWHSPQKREQETI